MTFAAEIVVGTRPTAPRGSPPAPPRAGGGVVVVAVHTLCAELRLARREHLGLVIDEADVPDRLGVDGLEVVGRLGQIGELAQVRDRALHRVAEHGHAEEAREQRVGHPRAGVHRHVAEVGPVLGRPCRGGRPGRTSGTGAAAVSVEAGHVRSAPKWAWNMRLSDVPPVFMTWTRYTPGSRTAGDRIAARRRPSAYARRRTSRAAGSGAVRGARYRTLVWRSTAMRRTETSSNT